MNEFFQELFFFISDEYEIEIRDDYLTVYKNLIDFNYFLNIKKDIITFEKVKQEYGGLQDFFKLLKNLEIKIKYDQKMTIGELFDKLDFVYF